MRSIGLWGRISVLIAIIGSIAWYLSVTREGDLSTIRSLPQAIGKTVTIKGRPGYIESTAQDAPRSYTFHDDYGGMIHVLLPVGESYPVIGATHLVTGEPVQTANGIKLQERSRKRAYDYRLLVIAVSIPFATLLLSMLMGMWMTTKEAEAWGNATVILSRENVDIGKSFGLRGNRVTVGRNLDPNVSVSLADPEVSKKHGVIQKRGKAIVYVDTNSENGSRVGNQTLTSNQAMPIHSGDVIQLGDNTIIRIDLSGMSVNSDDPKGHTIRRSERAGSGSPTTTVRNTTSRRSDPD